MARELDPHIHELLSIWELAGTGDKPSAEELCADRPELLDQLRQQITALEAAGKFMSPAVSATRLPAASLPLPKLIGPYRILEVLGQGGMGTVYKAEQRHPIRRTVALKVVKTGFDSREVLARFDTERQALARMDHPGIAKVLDAGADERGRPYFVMDYVPGQQITEFCDRNRLDIKQRLLLFIEVCEAIQHAHTKAIIHRDIKAANVLAFVHDGKPRVKVIDFGVAKALTTDRLTDATFATGSGLAIGTYEYMSPEQAEGSPDIDTRTDVYSLGVLLYELLAGVRPFDKETLAKAAHHEMQRIIREVEPPKLSTRFGALSDIDATRIAKARQEESNGLHRNLRLELEWIPLMALRKERDRRYASPAQLAGDLQNYLDGKPLIAGPEGQLYRAQKFIRRYRTAFVVATVIVLLLVGGVVSSSVFALREGFQRRVAEEQTGIARVAARTAEIARQEADAARVKASGLLEDVYINNGLEQSMLNRDASAALWYARAMVVGTDAQGVNLHRFRLSMTLERMNRPLEVTADLGLLALRVKPHGPNAVATVVDVSGHQLSTLAEPVTPTVRVADQSDDGRYLLTIDGNTARVWEVSTGRSRGAPIVSSGTLSAATFAANASVVFTTDANAARLWDAGTGKPRSPELHGPSGNLTTLYSAAVSADARHVATAANGDVQVFDLPSTSPRKLAFNAYGGVMALSHDGSLLCIGNDYSTYLIDMQSQSQSERHVGLPSNSTFVSFAAQGTRLITITKGQTVTVWDTASGQQVGASVECGGSITKAKIGGDGKGLIVEVDDASAEASTVTRPSYRMWGRGSVGRGRSLATGNAKIKAMTYSRDGQRLLTATDEFVQIWDVATGQALTGPIECQNAIFSPDGSRLLTRHHDGWTVRDARTGPPVLPIIETEGYSPFAAYSPDGRRIVTAGDGYIQLWDAATARPASPPFMHVIGTHEPIFAAVSPDGRRALSADAALTIVWDITVSPPKPLARLGPRRPPVALFEHADLPTMSGEFSRDGKLVLLNDGRVWEVATGRVTAESPLSDDVYLASFSPDGARFVTVDRRGALVVRQVSNGVAVLRPTEIDEVEQVAFSPDGSLISVSGYGHSGWFDAGSGRPLHLHVAGPSAVRPDGHQVAGMDEDSRVTQLLDVIDWPVEDLVAHVELIADRTLDQSGALVTLSSDDWTKRHKMLQARHPNAFQLSSLDRQGFAQPPVRLASRTVPRASTRATLTVPPALAPATKPSSTLYTYIEHTPDERENRRGVRSDRIAQIRDAMTSTWLMYEALADDKVNGVGYRTYLEKAGKDPDAAAAIGGLNDLQAALIKLDEDDLSPATLHYAKDRLFRDVRPPEETGITSEIFEEAVRAVIDACAYCTGVQKPGEAGHCPICGVMLWATAAELVAREVKDPASLASLIAQARSINLDNARPLELLTCAEYFVLAGDYAKGVATGRRAIESGGTAPFFHKSLGWSLLRAGDRDAAEKELVLAFGSSSPSTSTTRATTRPATSPARLKAKDVDQWTAGYLLGTVSRDHFLKTCEAKYPALVWFYIGEKADIERRREEALAAYRKSASFATSSPHRTAGWAEYRISQMTKSLQGSRLSEGQLRQEQGAAMRDGDKTVSNGQGMKAEGEVLRKQGKTVEGDRLVRDGELLITQGNAKIDQAKKMKTEVAPVQLESREESSATTRNSTDN
jgi:serine/threonine protein kinase/WD40 repeat protein